MNTQRTARRGLGISLVCLLAVGAAAAEDKPLQPVASVEGISEYRLENGLQILLFPDSSKPTFTLNVTYYVGSRHEGRGEKGMAHLLEHLVFKGTPTHTNIWKALEDHGASFNGSTWVDRTNYYETLPSNVAGNLEWAIAMEADRMVNSHIAATDLESEFSVVRNEFEAGENDPAGVLWERMISTAYLWHNYGDSTIGSRSDIERVPIENLKDFYRRYYQPDNAVVILAGDFDPAEGLRLVRKHFGALPRPSRKLAETYTIEPAQDGARHVELERVGDVAAVGTVYHIASASHADYAALDVLQQILTDEPAGRLYKAMVEPGIAASVFGVAFGWREPGIALNVAQVAAGQDPDRALKTMTDTIEGLATREISEEEMKRAQRSLLKSIELGLKNSQRVGVELSEWASAGDWRLLFLHRDRLDKVTLDEVRRAAGRYFLSTNRTSGIFRPQKAETIRRTEVPQPPDVATLLGSYRGGKALAEGERFDATPQNIEARTKRTTLDNGMKLALLAKETRGDGVSAVITLRFGTEKDLAGRTDEMTFVPTLLMRGAAGMTYQQIQDKLDELKANVNMTSGGGFLGPDGEMTISIRTDREHLLPTLDLVHAIVTKPSFPAAEFEIVQKESIAGLEQSLSDPQARAFTHMRRAILAVPPSDVRYVPTIEESIERTKAVKIEDLRAFHRDFYGASHAQATVIGDFDPKAVEEKLAATFGRDKSPRPYARIERRLTRSDGGGTVIETPDKTMAMVAAATTASVRDDDPDFAALHLANYVLGASAKSRLLERLRQKEGLSYGAGSFFAADSQDRQALLGAFAICAPENATKAEASLLDEVRRLASEGVPAAELEDAKQSYALQVKNDLANDGLVAGMLNDGLYLDRTMSYWQGLYDAIQRLTAEQVKQALSRHVDPGALIHVKAGDLAGK